ncbi:TetR/AcrR family transcriptional regulator [Paenactinomyces guangxiensis]|uniref:TetR/AcrR family transcriptional regulator n=1 Tax=Paenactinomyces guangxiensis TaxID=1490290 RepID=A0A7W2A881_9BACL|nr:TetR/AcrR family transcriptional regulator [Paenactinomyces guangxiensis]MBA4493894.1 TetR/AcrR family transcriptional regulator [Paenactinomyces guangxiensis]MBH8591360.1 TetR/AcrR family transcriptional regulator [Paenactinomyces guangxiensis]
MNDQLKALLKESHNILIDTNLTDKQKDIIRAALELFAEKGYDGTTTQSIAQKAKVSEKTLFKYYRSKQELFRQTVYPAMLQALQPMFMERIEGILSKENDYHDILHAVFKDRVEFAIENTDVMKLVFQELLLSPEFREVMSVFVKQNVLPRISQVFQTMSEAEHLSMPLPSLIRVVLSLLAGYVITRTILIPDQEWDDEKEIQFMLDILFNGIDR